MKSFISFVSIVGVCVLLTTWSGQKIKAHRRNINYIVVHHSDTEGGNAQSIKNYHVGVLGWDDIGYHIVVTNGNGGPDGQVQIGRPEHIQGAHCLGRNADSLGICLIGNKDHPVTEIQLKTLIILLIRICKNYNIVPSASTIIPHHERCPSETLGDLAPIIEEVKNGLN